MTEIEKWLIENFPSEMTRTSYPQHRRIHSSFKSIKSDVAVDVEFRWLEGDREHPYLNWEISFKDGIGWHVINMNSDQESVNEKTNAGREESKFGKDRPDIRALYKDLSAFKNPYFYMPRIIDFQILRRINDLMTDIWLEEDGDNDRRVIRNKERAIDRRFAMMNADEFMRADIWDTFRVMDRIYGNQCDRLRAWGYTIINNGENPKMKLTQKEMEEGR